MSNKNKHTQCSPEYIEMMRKNRRALGKIHKEAKNCPSDYSFGLEYLVQFLRFMRDYYKLNEKVIAIEDKEWKEGVKYTRLESLEITLYYYDKWQTVIHEYISLDEESQSLVYKLNSKEETIKKVDQLTKHYKEMFFKCLNNYIEEWWD